MALILALAFIIVLFWRLNLHYVNILFAIGGFHIFSVYPPTQDNLYANPDSYILITRSRTLHTGQNIVGLRLSNTVYMQVEDSA